MSQVEGTGYCPVCKEQRLTRRPGTNHVLHLILTIVTLGLWGIVWIIVAISNRTKGQRCSVCGAGTVAISRAPQTALQTQEPPPGGEGSGALQP